MYSFGINTHKPGCHLDKNETFSFAFTNNQTEGSGVH